MVAGLGAFEDEPVDVLPRESHAHPDAGRRLLVEVGRDRVVERPVEVRRLDVDRDPRHGQHRREPGCGARPPPTRGRPEQLELLRGALDGGAQRRRLGQPATERSASTRSVRSQVNSGSSRPKCPYAEVLA